MDKDDVAKIIENHIVCLERIGRSQHCSKCGDCDKTDDIMDEVRLAKESMRRFLGNLKADNEFGVHAQAYGMMVSQ